METIFRTVLARQESGEDTVLCTIVASSGSTPRGAGAQMLVGNEGLLCGTIGGGSAERNALQLCRTLLRERRSDKKTFAMHPNGDGNIGMVCGGDVEVDFRYIPAADRQWQEIAACGLRQIGSREGGYLLLGQEGCGLLDAGRNLAAGKEQGEMACLPLPVGERCIVFGGGHIALALVPLLKTVGFRVTVVDDRPDFAVQERFPDAEQVLLGDYGDVERTVSVTAEDYVVVMTNGHNGDFEIQRQVLPKGPAYIGVIGSRSKTEYVNGKLRDVGISRELTDRVRTPIGTAIHAVTPAEIAVSIAGEMILERALLRESRGEILRTCPMHMPES